MTTDIQLDPKIWSKIQEIFADALGLDEDEIDMLGMEREAELVVEDHNISVTATNKNQPNEIDIG